jgi:hypothetical protein
MVPAVPAGKDSKGAAVTLSQILGAICLVFSVFVLVHVSIYKLGYRHGRKDAEEWIATLEAEVDEARQQIWRESGRP